MRVLHLVAFPTMTGPADPALGLARAQRAAGIDVAIAIDQRRSGDMRDKVHAADVPIVEGLTLSTKANVFEQITDAKALKKLTARYDVVHTHASHGHALAAFRHAAKILVRSIHHPRGARRRGLQGVVYKRTDGFIMPAEAHRTLLLESYDVDPDRVIVVPGAIDPRRFHAGRDGASLRAAEGIAHDDFVFGMVARIKAGRGHERLLDAFERVLAETDRPVRLVLIGKGEGEPAIDAAIAARGLTDRVHRYGFRDADLPEAIKSCDVTILLEEGNDAGCRAVLESLALGVPVIGAAHPAIHDALVDTDAGWLIPTGETDPLVRAMNAALAEDPARRAARSGAAVRHIEAHHTDDRRAATVQAFYERLLERRGRPT